MRLSLRAAGHLGVLLLAVRLLVDVATPLLPGAFWLDPNGFVVAARASDQIAASAAAVQSPSIARHAACTSPGSSRWTAQPPELRRARYLCTSIPRITYRTEPTASTFSPDDD
jgi:hypothetical protein